MINGKKQMNRTEMKQYKDPKDRKLVLKFFKDRGIELTEGLDKFEVDLEGRIMMQKYLTYPLRVYGINGRRKTYLEQRLENGIIIGVM